MHLKKFHVLLIFLIACCLAAAGYFYLAKNSEIKIEPIQPARHTPVESSRVPTPLPVSSASSVASVAAPTPAEQVAEADAELKKKAQESIAVVGEAYKEVRKKKGDVAKIAGPLREAKKQLEMGEYEDAYTSSRKAWDEVKTHGGAKVAKAKPVKPAPAPVPKVEEAASESSSPETAQPMAATGPTYEVKAGETLWDIAAHHSPVMQGPAWVAIWRANESKIQDFDHVPPGTVLVIPQNRADYVMKFWQPR